MSHKIHDDFNRFFASIPELSAPTEGQKQRMLQNIMADVRQREETPLTRMKRFMVTYPWRTAFGFSAVQALLFTAIFGTNYTNLVLWLFGGGAG